MLISPGPLFVVGLAGTNRRPRLTRVMTIAAAWFALGCAVVAVGTYSLGMIDSPSYLSVVLPMQLGVLAVSVDVNALTVLMLLLVALVGLVVARYSYTYLDGDAHEGRFHRWLSLTLGSFLMLIVSGNLWGFLIFWVATSLCLHQLLAFYRERPLAVLAARKKYLLHRIADASLLGAFVLIVRTLHTAQFAGIGVALATLHTPLPASLQVASGLLVLSAILKSAQFPFHGWLIQVMEAPTPVSALLHAGIIYTGAFLLLRMVPIMSRVVWSGDALIVAGLVSIATASLMMMTATNIKGSLAYSTCGQMGFMLMECGLGLYSLALLHIVSHAVYKAHAFLSSGSVVDHFRVPELPAVSRAATLWKAIGSLVIVTPVVIGMGVIFGVPLFRQTPLIVMGIILTVAISHLLLQGLNTGRIGVSRSLSTMILLSALVSTAYFGLDALFTALFGTVLPAAQVSGGMVQDGLLGLIIAVFVGLLLVQQMLPRLAQHPFWQAVYVHLYNDLYIDMVFSRLIRRAGPGNTAEPISASREDQLREATS
ncbi:MAG: proton-conducting transporter membrane subunit [Thermaerobacter sp.]|nr:proton-conducting transporter membrane subunit [Thermaerobacter sp.]